MVGTRATPRFAARAPRTQRRRSEMASSSIMGGRRAAARSVEAVLGARIRAVAHLRGVGPNRLADRFTQGTVALEELRIEPLVEAKHVVQDEHLAVASRARPDPDGGDGE